jgi:hypothetical protein
MLFRSPIIGHSGDCVTAEWRSENHQKLIGLGDVCQQHQQHQIKPSWLTSPKEANWRSTLSCFRRLLHFSYQISSKVNRSSIQRPTASHSPQKTSPPCTAEFDFRGISPYLLAIFRPGQPFEEAWCQRYRQAYIQFRYVCTATCFCLITL